MMPGFGDNPNTETKEGDGMMPAQMICAIARYESTLHGDEQPASAPPTTEAPTTTTTSTTQPASGGESGGGSSSSQAPFCSPEALNKK
jgi:hypothetical protein